MQRHGLHAGACIAVFHTATAVRLSTKTQDLIGESEDLSRELPEHFDRCMHVMCTAALAVQELQSLHAPCTDLAAYLTRHLVIARDVLDGHTLECNKQQVADAILPELDFASEAGKLQAFQVNLQPQECTAQKCSRSLREKSNQELCGVPKLPAPRASHSKWRAWIQCMQDSHAQSVSNIMLCLQQVEQHFFLCAEVFLSNSPVPPKSSAHSKGSKSTLSSFLGSFFSSQSRCLSPREVEECVELLTLYSQVVANIEARSEIWTPKQASNEYIDCPMLMVQLRSTEALLTWIVMCLIHQRVAAKEWTGLARYRLPVASDDLRHLCRGGNSAAQRAVCIVAEYILRVADGSTGRLCFSLQSEDTIACAVDYASTLACFCHEQFRAVRFLQWFPCWSTC